MTDNRGLCGSNTALQKLGRIMGRRICNFVILSSAVCYNLMPASLNDQFYYVQRIEHVQDKI